MRRRCGALVASLAAFCSGHGVNAQQAAAMSESHAPDVSLERPALSQGVRVPTMAGMDTDMNDAALGHRLWLENLEGVLGTRDGGAWDAQGWLGGDIDKLWVKTEGKVLEGTTSDAKIEALWDRAASPYWDTQFGFRHDFGAGPAREWVAFGVQGLTPYWFDLELTAYVGEEARTAGRLKAEYDLYLTQRLVLKPEVVFNFYGKPDPSRQIGAGLSDGEFALRLRYDVTRRIAPYGGFSYDRKFAGSALRLRQSGIAPTGNQLVIGIDTFF